jgi:hypothetical protein
MQSPRKLEVTWNKLSVDDSNGEITKYEVCYALGSVVPNCSTSIMVIGVDNTTTDITGLKPATLYTVAFRASTKEGYGPLGEHMSVTTNESGELNYVMCQPSPRLSIFPCFDIFKYVLCLGLLCRAIQCESLAYFSKMHDP